MLTFCQVVLAFLKGAKCRDFYGAAFSKAILSWLVAIIIGLQVYNLKWYDMLAYSYSKSFNKHGKCLNNLAAISSYDLD